MAFEQTTPIVGEPHSLDLLSDRCHVLLGNIVRMSLQQLQRFQQAFQESKPIG